MKKKSFLSFLFFGYLFAFALCCGCQSYTIMQTNVFANDDGNVTKVEYGRSESDHVNEFISPATGKKMEFKSKLMIRVTAPNLDCFIAWQCMNFQNAGTMYKTDNEEWMFLASGFTFFAYCRQLDGRYLEVYRGVLCDTKDQDKEK